MIQEKKRLSSEVPSFRRVGKDMETARVHLFSEDGLDVAYGEQLVSPGLKAMGHPLEANPRGARRGTSQLSGFVRKTSPANPRPGMEMETIDLNRELLDFDKRLKKIVRGDIHTTIWLDPKLKPIKANAAQIRRMLTSLATNGNEAMPNGGMLTLETSNAVLDDDFCGNHEGLSPGQYVMVAVEDTGPTVNTQGLDGGCESYPEGEAAPALATVYGIVKGHGGSILLSKEPDEGAHFRIYFPVSEKKTEHRRQDELDRSRRGHSETILVVEDDVSVRCLASRILKKNGYRVIEAEDTSEALSIAKRYEWPIDLLLTDIIMPKMNGKELSRRITGIRPGIRVVYMSGYTDNVLSALGGADRDLCFVQKPFTVNSLTQQVASALKIGRTT